MQKFRKSIHGLERHAIQDSRIMNFNENITFNDPLDKIMPAN